jgi:hypothetical protein
MSQGGHNTRRTLALVALVALLGNAAAYPAMPGSCEGVFSGAHVPKKDPAADEAGGWRIQVVPRLICLLCVADCIALRATVCGAFSHRVSMRNWQISNVSRTGSAVKTAHVSLLNDDSSASYSGFLLKSFDAYTGAYIGKFSDFPSGTELFRGCPVAEAALGHSNLVYFDGKANALRVKVEWPADRELGFAFFPVQSLYVWYEAYASTCPPLDTGPRGREMHNKALKEGFFSTRLGLDAWAYLYLGFYMPMLLLIFAGAASHRTNRPRGLGSRLNFTVPLKNVPSMLQLSLGEWMSHALFYSVQIVIVALMTAQIAREARDMNLPFDGGRRQSESAHSNGGQRWYPNPWDAYFGRASGRLLQANLGLTLLLPTRNAVWPSVLGISFERCVKYHRIVGRCTFINLIVHFVAMVMVYGSDVLMVKPKP